MLPSEEFVENLVRDIRGGLLGCLLWMLPPFIAIGIFLIAGWFLR